MDGRVLSDATIRWRARRDVERRLQQIREMHRESYAPQSCSREGVEDGQNGSRERVAEENSESDTEDTGNERVLEEDIVEMDTSNAELAEEESDSDHESDETVDHSDSCNLGDSLRNWALTFGVSLVALTALLGLLRFYHPDLPKDARTLLKTKISYNIEKRCGGLYYYIGIMSSIKQKLYQAFESVTDGCTLKLQINI